MTFAHELRKIGKKHNTKGKVRDMNEFNEELLTPDSVLVLVAACFGHGEPTDNAKEFYYWLMSKERDAEKDRFKGLQYTVFGMWSCVFFLSLFLSSTLSLSPSLPRSLSLSLSVSPSLSLSLSLSLHSLSLPLPPLSLSPPPPLSLSLYLYVYIRVCISVSSFFPHTSLPTVSQNTHTPSNTGLGQSQHYPERYQAVGKNLDRRLEELGATRILERGEGDDSGDIEEDFEIWSGKLWDVIETQTLSEKAKESVLGIDVPQPPDANKRADEEDQRTKGDTAVHGM